MALVGASTAAGAATGALAGAQILKAIDATKGGGGCEPGPYDFDDVNQAMNAALQWLLERGFTADQETIAKLSKNAMRGQAIGMQTADGKVGFRIEFDNKFDNKIGAHINVCAGKEKGPHFTFPNNESSVNRLQRRWFGCR